MGLLGRALAAALTLAALPAMARAVATLPISPARQAATERSASARFHPRRFGPHTYYGTIVALAGSKLTLRLRNGRAQGIDATQAIADNAYSQPLFVGKTVVIDGAFTNGVFVAAHIYRVTTLQDLRGDR